MMCPSNTIEQLQEYCSRGKILFNDSNGRRLLECCLILFVFCIRFRGTGFCQYFMCIFFIASNRYNDPYCKQFVTQIFIIFYFIVI